MGVAPFLCAVDLHWRQLTLDEIAPQHEQLLAAYSSVRTLESGPCVCAVASDEADRFHIARANGALAVGNVRLDDTAAYPVNFQSAASDQSHVQVALDSWLWLGDSALRTFVGDFAMVMLDWRRRRLVACRDALGVRLLVSRRIGSVLFFASHAWILGDSGLSRAYIADFILGSQDERTQTVFQGVSRLAPASAFQLSGNKSADVTLWSALDFPPSNPAPESPGQFLSLLQEAIRTRTLGEHTFWAQLSGGLDSSSVVSVSATMSEAKIIGQLGGTVTFIDSLGTGDESTYSDEVVKAFGLRNHRLIDFWPWRDDGEGPPRFCDPHPFYAFFELRRVMCKVVREAGARVLLTGLGSDHYLSAEPDFLSDLVWHGRMREALVFLSELAVGCKKSFWRMLWSHAVVPLLPFQLQTRVVSEHLRIPPWLRPDFVRKYRLQNRVIVPRPRDVGRGQLFQSQMARALHSLDHYFARGPLETEVEARHPFLHRPLLEYALALPIAARIAPLQDKGILRQAVIGILPERVRNRSGKGGIDSRIVWAFQHENNLLRHLVRHSVLADLGCIEPRKVVDAIEGCRRGLGADEVTSLFFTLSLESWMAAQFGHWPDRSEQPPPSTDCYAGAST